MKPTWNEGIRVEPARHRYYRQQVISRWQMDPAQVGNLAIETPATEPGVTVSMPQTVWNNIETEMTRLASRNEHPAIADAWRQYCLVVAMCEKL